MRLDEQHDTGRGAMAASGRFGVPRGSSPHGGTVPVRPLSPMPWPWTEVLRGCGAVSTVLPEPPGTGRMSAPEPDAARDNHDHPRHEGRRDARRMGRARAIAQEH